jgi:fucose 4-O-acetylase-like acetyltransferase
MGMDGEGKPVTMGVQEGWLDTLKGVGIGLVVFAHVNNKILAHDLIFLFHMPLFFFIGGLVFRPGRKLREAISLAARRMLIPYATFLLVIFPPYMTYVMWRSRAGGSELFFEMMMNAVVGGRELRGWVGVFWFITCLFLTRLVYTWIRSQTSQSQALGLIVIAMTAALWLLASFPDFALPWSAEGVPVALFFFWLGETVRSSGTPLWLSVGGWLLACVGFWGIAAGQPWSMNFKLADYGIPYLSIAFAGGTSIALISLSKGLDRLPVLNQGLRLLGRGSLVIMFLHQPLQLVMRDVFHLDSGGIRFAIALSVSLLSFIGFRQFAWTRALFLGSISDQRTLFGRRNTAISS